MRAVRGVDDEMERRVEDLGYELVDVQWGGSGRRPMLKVRIDRVEANQGDGVTVQDCAKVSRALEEWLDEHEGLGEKYVLEVSSPGVDRPLVRGRDFDRFRGQHVALLGSGVLLGKATRLEGELLGLADADSGSEAVLLRLQNGEEVSVPRSDIRKAHLVFTWK